MIRVSIVREHSALLLECGTLLRWQWQSVLALMQCWRGNVGGSPQFTGRQRPRGLQEQQKKLRDEYLGLGGSPNSPIPNYFLYVIIGGPQIVTHPFHPIPSTANIRARAHMHASTHARTPFVVSAMFVCPVSACARREAM